MKLSKLYDIREMNSYQFLALTGLVMTLLAHLILLLVHKKIANFQALYVVWLVSFSLGTIANLRSKPGQEHHHHH